MSAVGALEANGLFVVAVVLFLGLYLSGDAVAAFGQVTQTNTSDRLGSG
ncbi:MAG: hypothetical protein ACJ8C4_09260 [Gemmataceae bacterium]